jgi:RNA polymerase sigma factor (sigma-70 family)
MDDREIVAEVRLEDRDGVAALYDRYADVLHDFARRRVHSQADASDVVHDTFQVAVECNDQLRNPDRLRPWLYAIARTELHRRYRHPVRYVELDAGDEGSQEPANQEPGPQTRIERAERAEMIRLMRIASAGLADTDRELLDLHLRHGLVGADLAAAAGLRPTQAAVALDRVRDRLTRTLGVVLLSRRPVCEDFAAIWDAQPELTPLARKRLARHVDECEICSEEQAHRLRPEMLLSAIPLLPAPPDVRRRLLAQGREAPGGQFWDDEGFPWPSRPHHRRWPAWVAVAAAVLLLTVGTVVLRRPITAERAVADGPTTEAPTATGTSDQPLLPGTILVTTATTTTSTATTTTTTRTTTTTPTRNIAPETVPPDIGAATLKPTTLSAALAGGDPSCSTHPPSATETVVSASVTDPSRVAAVTMVWSVGGYGGTVTMSPGPRDSYTGTAGPVDAGNLAPGSYALSVTVIARDGVGNETRRTTTFGQAVTMCAP